MSYTLESSVENVGGSSWETGLSVQVTKKFGKDKGTVKAPEASGGVDASFTRSLEDGKATD